MTFSIVQIPESHFVGSFLHRRPSTLSLNILHCKAASTWATQQKQLQEMYIVSDLTRSEIIDKVKKEVCMRLYII
jgi:hypothetical protein